MSRADGKVWPIAPCLWYIRIRLKAHENGMTILWTILGFLKSAFAFGSRVLDWVKTRTLKKAGADEAYRKGSEAVDDLILDVDRAKQDVDHSEDAIVNDPNNRANG